MENTVAAAKKLAGWDTHGFFSMEDLDVDCIMKEARERWLRPNEIHAILCNYSYFSINVRPVNLPQSGRIILFDRKKLRNFRKDGHNWKKKKDGKTIKEAHEHLKVGTEEKIHVYYAHGEDNPTFVRRCYWLLDKTLEHIVLVHYRETHEGTLSTSADSMSSPGLSDPSVMISDETDSVADRLLYSNEKVQIESGSSTTLVNHEMRLHEINTLEWEELVVPDNPDHFIGTETEISFFEHHDQFGRNTLLNDDAMLPFNNLPPESSPNMLSEPVFLNNSLLYEKINNFDSQRIDGEKNTDLQRKHSSKVTVQNHLHTQESFGSLMNYGMADSPDPLNGSELIDSVDTRSLQSSTLGQLLTITDISPAWGFAAEETKVLLTGLFNEGNLGLGKSNLYCVCGDACNPVENFQHGVFRCIVSSHNPGLKRLYFSLDGQNPISQVINFEFHAKSSNGRTLPDTDEREEFRLQARLIHLLFSTSKSLDTLSSKASPTALKEGKIFVHKTSQIADEWKSLVHSIRNDEKIFSRAKDDLFTLTLKNRLYEWLLERVVRGGKTLEYDDQGQGVIHMCAMLDYTWAVYPFKLSGLSLDYRDKSGWTALHWAAYCGRENMVAALLSAGAKPNLVTDPNSEDPSGCIAADLASKKGHEGLSGYLAEKALVAHFEDMKIAGNIIGSLETENRFELTNAENLSEEELHLKDALAAYRTAADAAGRIQTAFREQSFKLRRKAVEECAITEEEARGIVAAMKIQHAYRKYEARKQITAASRIQCRFRTWKIRKDFLNMRRQAIRIQATFRGFQARKSYRKIIWSVGVLEKAIIRWRLRKKGFRGLQILPMEENQKKEGGDVEDFFQVGRKQAEDRTVKAVVRVQAMFRSKQAQQEYRRMKLAHNAARLEYEGLDSPDIGMR